MNSSRTRAAFTLIEMIIAITVFTIFIGFAISTYLVFHRSNQDALTQRSLLMEAEALLNEISDAARENRIDYVTYADQNVLGGEGALEVETLYLVSPDGQERTVYSWDAEQEALSMQRLDALGNALTEAQVLHSENLTVSDVNFRIFPSQNPYENRSEDALQYQPMVTFTLNFSMPGRMDEEIQLELHTSVTSRFYQ
ncbi:type II secretion system protein [Candidatus Peregrinibacteria bacterium]|nr:MAG: type II secretion system protein [Candidatus Peregrinibacteria bacterium]